VYKDIKTLHCGDKIRDCIIFKLFIIVSIKKIHKFAARKIAKDNI